MMTIQGVTIDSNVRRIAVGVSALRLRNAAVAAGFVALCCVPWTVRNYRAFHTWVPLRSTLPLQLWLGNNEVYDPHTTARVAANPEREDMRRYFREGEVAFMRSKGAEAQEFIGRHPGLYAELSVRRLAAFWTGLVILGLSIAPSLRAASVLTYHNGSPDGVNGSVHFAAQAGCGVVDVGELGSDFSSDLLFDADVVALPASARSGDCSSFGGGHGVRVRSN